MRLCVVIHDSSLPRSCDALPGRSEGGTHAQTTSTVAQSSALVVDSRRGPWPRARPSGAGGAKEIAEKVQTEVAKQRAREQRKYHAKKGAQRTEGRPRGSKRKQDTRIRADGGGVWD